MPLALLLLMRKKIGLIIIITVVAFVIYKVVTFLLPIVHTAGNIVIHPFASLKSTNNHTNVLLLGIGGGTHDGPDLTDTIMLASIDWKKDSVTLVSIPRDLWAISIPGSLKKINEAYADGGLSEAESVVSQVTGQPVHYGLRLDFQGFVDAIDQIGGVDVSVQRTLDDYNYPITGKEDDTCGHTPEEITTFNASDSASLETNTFDFYSCRFKHLHFDPGQQHMDGETALEFARSRHAVGAEGSDFARSARQQLIIEAVRNKLISSAFFSPQKLLGLYDIMKSSIDTDMTQQDLGLFLDKILVLKSAKINSAVIDYGDYTTGRAGLLKLAPITSDYDFASVLIPRMGNGNYSEIHSYVSCEVNGGKCTVADVSGTPTPSPAKSSK